jgi:hypothetical protein
MVIGKMRFGRGRAKPAGEPAVDVSTTPIARILVRMEERSQVRVSIIVIYYHAEPGQSALEAPVIQLRVPLGIFFSETQRNQQLFRRTAESGWPTMPGGSIQERHAGQAGVLQQSF